MQKMQSRPALHEYDLTTGRTNHKLGKGWAKFRARQLVHRRRYCVQNDVSLCERCEAKGKAYERISVHCDHIKARDTHPELARTPSNLQWLCRSCHSRKTMAERRGEGFL